MLFQERSFSISFITTVLFAYQLTSTGLYFKVKRLEMLVRPLLFLSNMVFLDA